jgi:DNA mismatch endonuclease Vsr
MTDTATSARMSVVRQVNTGIESSVAAVLRGGGIFYRRNVKSLPGSPDFANKSKRWAVFVNGCFWHHHSGCPRATIPRSNVAFWTEKFKANRTRDARAIRALRQEGYQVVIVWECERGEIAPTLRQIIESGRVNRR